MGSGRRFVGELGREMDQDSRRDHLVDALRRAGSGDAAALCDIYNTTSAKLFGICLRILGESAEAEDVLQEVYTIVWRRAATFDNGRASPISWLATIARNRSIDRLRARPAQQMAPLEAAVSVADGAPIAELALESAQGVSQLYACLDELEGPQRNAIRSAFLDGLTYDAIAYQSGVPVGTMKSWIRRSLLKLRACMER
jgi:RNA polymerase sigma-70 factor (ECF subfamily)